ncbi:tetratricopeptide repeat protein [Rheinheimera riviphila]|uniref:Tetratricopeptide repeat protein n=1 Tax=Rheinheimera riviphila TaxID=1834037 RepID=A0A437QG82_9GAMM|nr:tetratricopeptide repeat protein [Rheinheimera riviphila]RVU33553.1 tetratricopeptide repeat protein [Rheinheimera riviphila]
MSGLKTFFSELKRRKVINTVLPYVGVVWLLLQVISVVVPLLSLPPLVGTFSAVLLFALFPVVLYLAWFYDLTSNGIVLTPADDSGTVTPLGWKNWVALCGILLLSCGIGFSYFQQVRSNSLKAEEGIKTVQIADSIAVVGIKDQSPEQDQQYLAEGLTEEITSLLGKMPNLTVAASGSGLVLSKQGLDPVAIGRRLEVKTVLTGSVRRTGDQLKVRLELLETEKGHTLWTETLQRSLSDVFALETQIARAVVNLLQDNYLDQTDISNHANTQSVDAYVLYLKGREQYRLQTTEAIKEARKLFEQAIALDPEYAQAYVALADTFVLLSDGKREFGVLKPDIAGQLASENLTKAFLRQPEIAEAFAIQGKVFEIQQQNDQALAAYDKAISLNPNLAIAYMWRYILLKMQGRYDESLISLEQSYRLDPVSVTTLYNTGLEMSLRGEYAEAEQRFTQLIADFPESPWGVAGLGGVAAIQGNLAQSIKFWQQAHLLSPQNKQIKSDYVSVMLRLGMAEQAKPMATEPFYEATLLLLSGAYTELFQSMDFQLAANPDDGWIAFEAGWYQLLVGDKTKGIELLIAAHKLINNTELYAMPMCSPAIELAWALQQRSDDVTASSYIQKCRLQLEDSRKGKLVDYDLAYLAARLAVLAGEHDRALQQLELAISHGWREWWLSKDPLMQALKDNDKFRQLHMNLSRLLDKEKQQALLLFPDTPTQQTATQH